MALEAIPQALWFFLPAFVANPMAVVFGGGTPIDFGRTLGDHERLFGDGKTWRGLLGGTFAGAFLGSLLNATVQIEPTNATSSFGPRKPALASTGTLLSPAIHGAGVRAVLSRRSH